jgi:putative spermidine/putrescine transport system ATP-binding protein
MGASPGGALELRGVEKRFGSFVAVERCDLAVAGGEFVSLLGPSGSGKTTILRMVAGFLRPSAGVIEIDGKNMTSIPAHRRNLGVVFQSYTLFPHMTAAENVAFPLQMRRTSGDQQRTLVAEALRRVELGDLGERYPRELSGGQQQRVAVARALVFRPRILLMDEPFGALDKRLREELQTEVRRLHQRLGVTVVFVTHDQAEALAMSDRIAIMSRGRIEQIGSGAALYESPASVFVANFMGETNAFRGELQERGGVCWIVGPGWEFPGGRSSRVERLAAGASVVLVLRPELMRLVRDAGRPEQGTTQLRGRLVSTTYLGATSRHEIGLPDGRTVAILTLGREGLGIAQGDEVSVEWRADDGILLPDPDAR